MKARVDTPASKIIRIAADKLGLRSDQPDDLKLCEVKSTGGSKKSTISFKKTLCFQNERSTKAVI